MAEKLFVDLDPAGDDPFRSEISSELAAPGGEDDPQFMIVDGAHQHRRQITHIAGLMQKSVTPVDDVLGHTARPSRNDRQTGGHSFEDDRAKWLRQN